MKKRSKSVLVAIAALIVGVSGGYYYGSRSTSRVCEERACALALSHAAQKATYATEQLKRLRDGKPDLVADHIETQLDFALIDLAREYSPERDFHGTAAGALIRARQYRTAHPRTPSIDSIQHQVDAALALKVNEGEQP